MLGKQTFEFKAEDYEQHALDLMEQYPPDETVKAVWLETPFWPEAPSIGLPLPCSFNSDTYAALVQEKNYRDAYFKRTGKHWHERHSSGNANKPVSDLKLQKRLAREECLVLLRLKPFFTLEELKDAYKRASERFYPDNVASFPEHLRALVEKDVWRLNQAYAQLNIWE